MNLDSLKKKISDLASNAKKEFGSANDKEAFSLIAEQAKSNLAA